MASLHSTYTSAKICPLQLHLPHFRYIGSLPLCQHALTLRLPTSTLSSHFTLHFKIYLGHILPTLLPHLPHTFTFPLYTFASTYLYIAKSLPLLISQLHSIYYIYLLLIWSRWSERLHLPTFLSVTFTSTLSSRSTPMTLAIHLLYTSQIYSTLSHDLI
jgi:hypothetical protein